MVVSETDSDSSIDIVTSGDYPEDEAERGQRIVS